MKLLEVSQITKNFEKSYGFSQKRIRKTALQQLSFSMEEGESLGILGPSGSGKSTLAQMIMGFCPIEEGEIRVLGMQPPKKKSKEAARIAYYQKVQLIFQNPFEALNPKKTLEESLLEPRRNLGDKKTEAVENVDCMMERCGLEKSLKQRYPRELSGGQCQRAAIAKALLLEPKLLICDEITSALDENLRVQFLEFLKELQLEKQIALLYISHRKEEVEALCQNYLVLKP